MKHAVVIALKQVESPETVITRPRKDVKQAKYIAFKKAMPSSAGENAKLRTQATGHDGTCIQSTGRSSSNSRLLGNHLLRSSRGSRGYRAHLCSRNAPAISGDTSGGLSVRIVGGFVGCSFQAHAEHAKNGFSQIRRGRDFFMRSTVYPESIANTLLWSNQKIAEAFPTWQR